MAVLGVDCASGDTYASERGYCTLQNMFVPEPVIRMAIAPLNRDGADRLSKALHRFRREDPTLQVATETGWSLEEFLSQLCWQKAGLSPSCYKDQDTEIQVFQAQVIK